MAVPVETNGNVFQRRYSRAYDQPIVHNTTKGNVVIRAEGETTSGMASYNSSKMDFGLEALGAIVAKAILGLVTLVGITVSLLGTASLEILSQFIGFMILLVLVFLACSATFYWWGATSRSKVQFSIRSILSVYGVCIASDILARIVNLFSKVPPSNNIPVDISYFVSLATFLLFTFTLLFHNSGLNAMFSRESVLFVLCSLVFNYSSSRLFSEFLPRFVLPQMVHAGMLLGLSLSLAGYRFPSISLSGLYWTLNRRSAEAKVQPARPSIPKISVDHGLQGSNRKISNSSTQSKPRVSLSSISSMTSSPQGVDMESVSEARGLISDLLMNEDSIPVETQQKLRRVKDILALRSDRGLNSPRIAYGSSYSLEDERDYESDVSSRSSSKQGSNSLSVRPPWGKPRSVSVVQMRRSSSKFSTTTTASGMPVLENEPLDRTRSVALRDVKARLSEREKRYSVHKLGRERLGSFEGRPNSAPREKLSSISTTSFKSNVSDSDTSEVESGTHTPSAGSTHLPTHDDKSCGSAGPASPSLVRSTSDTEETSVERSQEGAESTEPPSPLRPRSYTDPAGHRKLDVLSESDEPSDMLSPVLEKAGSVGVVSDDKEDSEKNVEQSAVDGGERRDSKVFGEAVFKDHKFYSFTKYKRPSAACDLAEYTSNEHLDMFENVAIWDYPIFELEEKAGNHILSHMAHMLFHEAGLMETFQIPQREFVNYFRALEANYGSNVYHNKTHAADVLHAVSYLMFEIIPEFSHEFQTDDNTRQWKGYSRSSAGGNIASAFSILEVLACYMASAMHDFDHPGRTNAFLVGTKSHLALLYNDRSVLENHHAAASWHLLTNFEENNFLVSLEAAEMKRLRFLIIEAILATDLKMHFDLLSTFKAKTSVEEGGGIDWESEMDRLLVMQMVIKMADINTPTKSFDLHRSWSSRITEEFYQQSEEEAALNLPATIFMDRRHPEKLPAIQLSFIQHLVSPLFQACAEAGIIPGILESSTSDDPDKATTSGTAAPLVKKPDASTEEPIESDTAEDAEPKFMSIILTNLQVNFEGWKAELPKEEQDSQKEEIADVDEPEEDEEKPVLGVEPQEGGADGNASVVAELSSSPADSPTDTS